MRFRTLTYSFITTGLGLIASAHALAQIPERPIKIFIPYVAGGPSDVIARSLTQRITATGGPIFVIENKTGGGGVIAAQSVKQSTPDGTTLLLTDLPTFGINPNLLTEFPLDPVHDFKPVTLLFSFPSLLVVPTTLPAKSVAELVALARATPGGLAYGSQGQGSGGQLLAEMFGKAIGVPLVHVPYRGSAQAYPDLVSGRVSFMFGSYGGAKPFLDDGRLRALAVPSRRRLKTLPDLPTLEELGYRDMELDLWYGLVAPAGTPDDIIAAVRARFVAEVTAPDTVARLEAQGINVVTSTPAEFAALIKDDLVRLAPIVKSIDTKGK